MTTRPSSVGVDRVPEGAVRVAAAGSARGLGFRVVVVLVLAFVALIVVRGAAEALAPGSPGGRTGGAGAASPAPATGAPSDPAMPTPDVAGLLIDDPAPAPPLSLEGPDGVVSLADLRGAPVLVFFGYTHCPDVCPATIGTVGVAIDAFGGPARAILVSVDPERDTPAWLAEFVRYMPEGFTAASGSPGAVRAAADAWGVRYAKVDTGDPAAYTMSHTADVFVVDGEGRLRARLPFGTDAPTMTAVLDTVVASSGTTATPTPAPTATTPTAAPAAVAALTPDLVSSSVWSGGSSPVIFTLDDPFLGRASDPRTVSVQVTSRDGAPVGGAAPATAVHPTGIATVSFVADVDIPSPGPWTLVVTASNGSVPVARGSVPVTALDPGGTAQLGAPAPSAATRTPADVGGDLTWLTTDPLPDPRLSATSTTQALASGDPWVFVVDSIRFRVTPQCGQAVVMAKRLVDRWGSVPFIHHEPYRYSVVTTEPVLEGTLEQPRLTEVADAWGVGSEPWGPASMPWVFVIDGDGIVRAKYQGVIGSADIDVLLSLLAEENR